MALYCKGGYAAIKLAVPLIQVIVPGRSCSGRVIGCCDHKDDGIIVVKSLELSHYSTAIKARAIVCEDCPKTSHIAIVCRILGIPVVRIQSIDGIVAGYLQIDFESNCVYVASREFPLKREKKKKRTKRQNVSHQLSIINSVELIQQIKMDSNNDIDQLFLRSELLWLSLGQHPYDYLEEHGQAATTDRIFHELLALYSHMSDDVYLNFRGLDLRSDQHFFGKQATAVEPNPHLGMHGVRQLLARQDYLIAELLAVDKLYNKGKKRCVYSLPFIISNAEIIDVIRIRDKVCTASVKLGVFVETPAAVAEISSIISEYVDFVYVGTKDLAQLVLAVDRDNEDVAYLMNPLAPPVVKCIQHVIDECEKNSIPVYVFTVSDDLDKLLDQVPNIHRISIPASDYYQ